MVRDITAQKEAEQEISRLLSRERLLSRLPEALPVGLFEIDMAGHVTFTNDRMYTIAGQVPAATMEGLMPSVVAEDRPVLESARKGDAVGRVGGDEFIVICPRVESSAQAVKIAERIAAATTATVDVGTGVAELRTRVGVAWTTEAIDANAFLAQADSAMYESKRTGREGVTLFAPPGSDSSPPASRAALGEAEGPSLKRLDVAGVAGDPVAL